VGQRPGRESVDGMGCWAWLRFRWMVKDLAVDDAQDRVSSWTCYKQFENLLKAFCALFVDFSAKDVMVRMNLHTLAEDPITETYPHI
jgi:hypothetical protein